jgi:hypothetical protein
MKSTSIGTADPATGVQGSTMQSEGQESLFEVLPSSQVSGASTVSFPHVAVGPVVVVVELVVTVVVLVVAPVVLVVAPVVLVVAPVVLVVAAVVLVVAPVVLVVAPVVLVVAPVVLVVAPVVLVVAPVVLVVAPVVLVVAPVVLVVTAPGQSCSAMRRMRRVRPMNSPVRLTPLFTRSSAFGAQSLAPTSARR